MNSVFGNRADSLSVQQLRTFCSVFELGGYAEAERHLGLAGPTMWEQVKTLERIYHAKLFERHGRSIRPTLAGQSLYDLLVPIIANVDSTLEVLAEATDDAPKQVEIITGVRMMLEELGEPLRRFNVLYPAVKLRLKTADNRIAQEVVMQGKADLALLIEPPRELVAQGIICERLYPIEYLAVLPKKHRLAKKPEVSVTDILDEPLIVGNPNTVGRRLLEQAVFRLGTNARLNVVAETDNSAVTVACVRAGIGVGFIAGKCNGNLTRHVAARPMASGIGAVHVVAAYREGRQLTRVLKDFLKLIAQENNPGEVELV